MSEARANRKSPVRIATVLSQRALALGGTAAQRRLVHHVVVVERREVGQLDDDGRRHDARGARVAELGGEQHEQRAEPLAAGVDQVARGLGHEREVALDRLVQRRPRPRPCPRAARPPSAGSTLDRPNGPLAVVTGHHPCELRASADELRGLPGQVEDLGGPDAEQERDAGAQRDGERA